MSAFEWPDEKERKRLLETFDNIIRLYKKCYDSSDRILGRIEDIRALLLQPAPEPPTVSREWLADFVNAIRYDGMAAVQAGLKELGVSTPEIGAKVSRGAIEWAEKLLAAEGIAVADDTKPPHLSTSAEDSQAEEK